MPLINSVLTWLIRKRLHQIEFFLKYPEEVQQDCFLKLVSTAEDTEWGRKYDYSGISTLRQFKERVPVNSYEDIKPYIDRLRAGEQNILWPSEISWFAKSSGTTNDKSKFIPVSWEALEECHYKGGKDLLTFYCNNVPETGIFSGKLLGLGGSWAYDNENKESYHGDVSAILMQNLPFWVELMRTPSISIALMDEWEEKIEQMASITKDENVTAITGVPSWTLLLCKRVMQMTGKNILTEVWPNLELFVHGGVSFTPYREQYRNFMPLGINYLETYNASEGFFGIQDTIDGDDMLLMLDYGIFYEFMPMDQLGAEFPLTLPLEDVKLNENYALIISTNAGLCRYLIGDTIRFTSLSPYRIQVTGRTRSFINAFGEELIVDNSDRALATACEKTSAIINDYTACPVYLADNAKAAHEWLIEFEKEPESLEYFTEILDNALKSANSDYEAKRYRNMMLHPPVIRSLPKGSFYHWLKSKGKLGGQYKVPRLSNSRDLVEEILKTLK